MEKIIKGLHLTPISINSGDINLADSSEKVISKRFPNIKWTRKDCRLIYSSEDIELINKNYDFLLLGPGGIFLLDEVNGKGIAELNKKQYAEIKNYSGYQWIIKKNDFNKIKIPILVFSVGWNQFRNSNIEKEPLLNNLKNLISRANYFSVRHTGDINSIFNFIGEESSKIDMCFCPTIINAFDKKNFVKNSKIIGFQIANDRSSNRYPGGILERDFKFEEIYKTIEYFNKKKYEIHLIDQCVDSTFINWLKNKKYYKKEYKIISIKGKSTDFQNNYYKTLNTLFATRGHAQMIPIALGVNVVSIISHDKLKYFLQDISAINTGIEFSDITSDSILEAYHNSLHTNWLSKLEDIVIPVFNKSILKIDNIINSI
jgi:hypothetical protein